jgi:signal transduction histidine kinase
MNRQVRFHQALLAASVAVPLLLFGLSAWISHQEVFREADETIERTTTILHEHARKVFDSADLILAHVGSRLAGRPSDFDDPALSQELKELADRFDQVVSIWVSRSDGVIAAGSQPYEKGASIAPRDFFQALRDKDIGSYVSPAFTGRATSTASFAVSRRRPSADGSFTGTVHVALNPAYFVEFFREAAPRLPGSSTLLRADGAILARYPAVATSQLPPNNLISVAIAKDPDRGFFTGTSSIDGGERTFSYWRVMPFPVYAVFGVDTKAITRQWLDTLIPSAIGTALAIVTLLGMAWVILRRARAEAAALEKLQVEVRQRQDTEERLRHTQRLEAVGQLTGGVAHDFNNLLMIIIGNAERLARMTAPEKIARAREAILTAANHGVNLTRQLLAFARKQSLSPEVIDVGEAIASLNDMMLASLRDDIALNTGAMQPKLRIKADTGELKLAILNLVVNARDAIPSGGSVTVSTQEVIVGPGHALEHLPHGAYVAIVVADTGTGMAPEVLSKVFEPFFTTKAIGQGTGLGLSQVHGFTHQSGGTTTIESTVGAGTTVTMVLPRTSEAPRLETSAPTLAPLRQARILLVEDNTAVADVTRDILEQHGHSVIYAETADAAAALLNKDDVFDLVLSDVVMPGKLSGADLARKARTSHPRLPVVLMTGYNRFNADLTKEGFKVLAKPFQHEQLEHIIQDSLKLAS